MITDFKHQPLQQKDTLINERKIEGSYRSSKVTAAFSVAAAASINDYNFSGTALTPRRCSKGNRRGSERIEM